MIGKLKGLKKKKTEDEGIYLVGLDIGTEYVKALISEIKEDKIEVIGVGRAHQAFNDMQAGAISDIGAVVTNCDKALSEAEEQAGVSVRTAVIGIAGELVKGATITVKAHRKNPSKELDLAEIERIIKLVQERAEAKAKKQILMELGGKDIEIRLINSALVGISIDGYPVTNPIGFQGKEVTVQLYTAFAPLVHIGAIERTAQELDLDLLAVAAEPFAVARSVIGDDQNATMNAILMDVGGGTTDIAVINDGGVQGTKMFGIGGRAYTRSVERALDVTFEEAEDLKLSLSTNSISKNNRVKVESALVKTAKTWSSGVELALDEFSHVDHLPNKIYLCGGGSSLDILFDELNRSSWYKDLPFTKKPVIQHINPGQVAGVIDKTGKVKDHTLITAMGLLRVGVDTLQQQDSISTSSIKQKIDRMLQV
jgi:cell division protein FtsA